jgi:hypothetical protein
VVATKRLVPVLIASALLVAVFAAPGSAFMGHHHHHHHVTKSGSCTGSSGWWLEAGRMMMMDDIWVHFEVNTNKPGQDWRIKLTDGRTALWSGRRTTRPDGTSWCTRTAMTAPVRTRSSVGR